MKYIVKTNIFLLILSSVLFINAFAKEEYKTELCPLSSEYLEWEKLPDEEKKNVMMPPMCSTSETNQVKYSKFALRETLEPLPEKYDIREQSYTPVIKNQRQTGSCWAFATTTGLEAYIKKELLLDYQFSPRHIVYSNTRYFLYDVINEYAYNIYPNDGGNYFMSSNYLVSGRGPILESEMPFENREDLIEINKLNDKHVQLDVNDVKLYFGDGDKTCSEEEMEQIKKDVMKYGSVQISTYMYTENPTYYNSSTGAYYNNVQGYTNHAVTIVGWDDNYSRNNFLTTAKPQTNGAWIVQNSYGTTFGDGGYYYLSYEDINTCYFHMVIRDAEQTIEDNMYIHDYLGFNDFMTYKLGGVPQNSGYLMNVFDKKTNTTEILKEVTIATQEQTSYRIYYAEGNGANIKITDMQLIGTGESDSIGYVTYKLDEDLLIDPTVEQFSIAVYYESTNSYPLPISMSNSKFYSYMTLEEDKSFSSFDGIEWEDQMKKYSDITIINSIKVATDNYIETETYQVNEQKSLIYVDLDTTQTQLNENIKVSSDTYKNTNENTSKVYTGQKIGPYTVVVRGDVTGDGSAKMNDVMMISKYIVDGDSLTEDYLLSAADINKDSSIKMNDVMRISNYLVEGGNL